MIEFITQQEIETLTEQELNYRFAQIFNSLSRRQQALQECSQLIAALGAIQSTLTRRGRMPRLS